MQFFTMVQPDSLCNARLVGPSWPLCGLCGLSYGALCNVFATMCLLCIAIAFTKFAMFENRIFLNETKLQSSVELGCHWHCDGARRWEWFHNNPSTRRAGWGELVASLETFWSMNKLQDKMTSQNSIREASGDLFVLFCWLLAIVG